MLTVFNFVCLYAIYPGIDFTSSPITRLVSGQSLNHAFKGLSGNSQFFALKVTEVRAVQPSKAYSPIEVTELPMVTEVRPVQYLKAKAPIEVTELGMITEVRPSHSLKAKAPIEVTELGMVTEVRPVQPQKADSPISVTELGMVTEVRPVQPLKADGQIDTVPSLILIAVPLAISPLNLYAIFPI